MPHWMEAQAKVMEVRPITANIAAGKIAAPAGPISSRERILKPGSKSRGANPLRRSAPSGKLKIRGPHAFDPSIASTIKGTAATRGTGKRRYLPMRVSTNRPP